MKENRSETENDSKRKGGYPYLPLNLSLKVSDAIKELGGARTDIQKSVLAKHLGESEKSPTFSQRITSAKCFGLIEGHGAYMLTEVAKRYYFPTAESDKSAALLDIFSTPFAFKELLRRFDGDKLPTRQILANIMHREFDVPESWMDRLASYFINSAQMVGIIDGEGFLRFNAAQHETFESVDQPSNIHEVPDYSKQIAYTQPAAPAPPQANSIKSPREGINAWHFTFGGKAVHLETPTELSKPLWDKLNAYVQLLKPTDDNLI